MYRPFFFISIFLSFLARAQEVGYSIAGLSPDLLKNANAVVRWDEKTVDIKAQDDMTIRSKRVVTVLNEEGDKWVQAYVYYDDGIKVAELRATVYDALGKEVNTFKEKDFHDVSAVDGGTLYSDSRVKYLGYTPPRYPYTVVFEKETRTRNTAFLPNWFFLDGYGVATEQSRYALRFAGPDLEPRVLERNFEGYAIEKEAGSGSMTYSAKAIAALKYEDMAPSFGDIAPNLMVRLDRFFYEGHSGSANGWGPLGKWMYEEILVGRDELPETTRQMARNLVAGVEDPLDKARIIYKYVQDHTRYISVQVGIGGIQPITAAEVDRVKYGDCKGLTNYTKALLKAVGVPAYYTHVEATRGAPEGMVEEFPSLEQGNHVILNIPNGDGEPVWLECTSQTIPFGFLGDFTDDRKVFVIGAEGGKVAHTPTYASVDNSCRMEVQARLSPNGDIAGTGVIRSKGIAYDRVYGVESLDRTKVLAYYRKRWAHLTALEVASYTFQNDRNAVAFLEEVDVAASKYATLAGDRILFAPNFLDRNTEVPQRYRSRKLPFGIDRGSLAEDDYDIELPEGYAIEAIPEAVALDTEFGRYTLKMEASGEGRLHCTRRLLLNSGKFPKEKYGPYRDFMRDVARYDNAKIVLIKT